jgi:hydroxymethylglutaryl-CoA lyase
MSNQISLFEVGPRDGLQNEVQLIDIATKVELIERLANAGIKTIESGSFVSPKWVPQMAATEEVMTTIRRLPGVSYPVLTPNVKGLEGALAVKADTVAIFGAASEGFTQKNINCSIAESLERFRPVVDAATAAGIRVRCYVSTALGCPYDGAVPIASVVAVSKAVYEMGCYEIAISDTIGVGNPRQVKEVIRAVAQEVPLSALAGHYHDTYGQALANIWASIDEGVRVFDSSISGLGGCPYAKGASGNVATEDVVFSLQQAGFDLGIDLDALIDTSLWISQKLNREPGSKVTRAKAR